MVKGVFYVRQQKELTLPTLAPVADAGATSLPEHVEGASRP
jgi:hypothetical protein